MIRILYKPATLSALAAILWACSMVYAQRAQSTFTLRVSLPESTIHVGDKLALDIVVSNPTDHIVRTGEGSNGGMELEAVNAEGKDIGPKLSGSERARSVPRPTFGLARYQEYKPHKSGTYRWTREPNADDLLAGTYGLRVHCRDVDSGREVYSNKVTLTVLP
jgi:hypothetical protein